MAKAEALEGFDYYTLHGSHMPVSFPTPAAGAAATMTVPGSVEWEVLSVSWTYTASSNAATRIPFIAFLDTSGISVGTFGSPFTVVATNVTRVSFGVYVSQFGANSALRMGGAIPPMRLGDGMRIQLSATLIDTADTITDARLFVRQWDVRA